MARYMVAWVNFEQTLGLPVEIDIMEQFGKDAPEIKSTIHHSTSPEGVGYTKATTVADGASNFHVYAVNWTPNKIEFSIDGNVYHSQTNDASLPFNSNFYHPQRCN